MEQAMREKDDLAYFGKRAVDEEEMTAKAVGEKAQKAHARMARAYRKKQAELREHSSYRIVGEPE
jgi:hypothetical protein